MNVTPIIMPNGITPGSPFAQGHLVYVSATTPTPTLSSYAARVSTDSVSAVVYTDIPDSSGTYNALTNLTETLRVQGGAVIAGAGSNSVQIGPGASAGTTDSIAIGRAATVTSATQTVVIGGTATNGGNAGVVIGFNASLTSAAGVAIGAGANISGNAGGSNGVAIGQAATTSTNAGASSPIAIGLNATAVSDCVVIGSNASSNINHAIGVGSVVIGSGATSNKAQGFNVCIGYTATVTQTNAVAIGSGATVTAAASQTYSIAIGAGTTITGTQSITIGGGGANIGDNTLQLGAASTQIVTVVIGAGNTIATPAAKTIRFTNGTGTDNAAGALTIIAPRGTGAATPVGIVFQAGDILGTGTTIHTLVTLATLRPNATTAGISEFVFGQATARIVMGATNGIAFRNAANSADRFTINDAGDTITMSNGSRTAGLALNGSSSGELRGGVFFRSTTNGDYASLVSPASGTGGIMGMYWDGTVRRSAFEVADTTGFGTLALMRSGGNVVLGGTAAGATASGALAFAINATEPTTSVDLVHLYGFDLSAGNRALACFAEAALIASVDNTVTNKVPFRYNGTTLYLMATTSAA